MKREWEQQLQSVHSGLQYLKGIIFCLSPGHCVCLCVIQGKICFDTMLFKIFYMLLLWFHWFDAFMDTLLA